MLSQTFSDMVAPPLSAKGRLSDLRGDLCTLDLDMLVAITPYPPDTSPRPLRWRTSALSVISQRGG